MKVHVETVGDRSVGINPTTVTIEVSWDNADTDERAYLKRQATEFARELTSERIRYCYLDDECPECGSQKDTTGKCSNDRCVTNIPDEE